MSSLIANPVGEAGKRAFDLVVSAALLVVTSPLLLLVAIAVKRASPGPLLFGHQRIGADGETIMVLKFRTMVIDAEEWLRTSPELFQRYVESDFKLPVDVDPRYTRVGRFLRRTSLDELPQLINVLRGDMSMVGPRPVVRAELAHFVEQTSALLAVRPGITGMWAAAGRSSISYPERAHLELEYVRRANPLLDLVILVRTASAVLRRTGAH